MIPAQYEIVKASDSEFDVILFSQDSVLKSFEKVYPESIYIENSNFNRPVIVFPAFESMQVAIIFAEYWINALSNPQAACKSCPTVQKFFAQVRERMKSKSQGRETNTNRSKDK